LIEADNSLDKCLTEVHCGTCLHHKEGYSPRSWYFVS
jgi:hypothetical protein